jgi:hypothetical protein
MQLESLPGELELIKVKRVFSFFPPIFLKNLIFLRLSPPPCPSPVKGEGIFKQEEVG